MSNDAASVPSSVYVKALPSSGSVADTVPPIFTPAVVFSAIDRVVSVLAAMTGASLTSVTLIVTVIVSVSLPSVTVTTTV